MNDCHPRGSTQLAHRNQIRFRPGLLHANYLFFLLPPDKFSLFFYFYYVIKGTLSQDFRPPVFFSSNNSTWATDPRVKAFLKMTSDSRRYSTMKSIFLWSALSITPLTRVADPYWLDPDPYSQKSGAGSYLNLTLSDSGSADQWWAVLMTPQTLAG
jgi:hypothetical protein